MCLPQGEVLVGGIRDGLQGAGLMGEGVPWRGGWGRGMLEEVDAVEFPSSSSFTCYVQWYKVSRCASPQVPAGFLCDRWSGGGGRGGTAAAIVTTPAQWGAI